MFVIARRAKALACALLFSVCAFPAQAAEVIYDNTSASLGTQASEIREYGDEIFVAGVARIISQFQIEYVADFRGGNTIPTMRFRMYLNDPNNFYKPGEMLWQSEVMPILIPQGNFGVVTFQNLMFNGAPVVIPDGYTRITFTAEFSGLTMQTATEPRDFAGLLYYGVPTVGLSYNDFWRRTPNGTDWQLVRTPGVFKNNFGARLEAVPEPSVIALGSMLAAAGLWQLFRRRS
jgi:hypothetical protein